MTFQDIFLLLFEYRAVIAGLIFAAPWLTWLLCVAIPGQREEPLLLSANLLLSALTLVLWAGYLAYASSTGGWEQVIEQADILLLFAPLYYVGTSLWVSKQRLPLDRIPAFRMFQGLAMIAAAYLFLSWMASKTRIIFLSYVPFRVWLWIIAIVIALGYWGYLRATGQSIKAPSSSPTDTTNKWHADIEQELNNLKGQARRTTSEQTNRARINLNTLIVPLVLIAIFLGLWGVTLKNAPKTPSTQPASSFVLPR